MIIGWTHPLDNSDEWDGTNDAAMEWFQGDPITNFAREGTQNSLDAPLDNQKKVIIKLNLKEVDVASIPNVEELKENVKMAYDSFLKEIGSDGDDRPKIFYKKALNTLNSTKCLVFEFSDFNTTGMWWESKKKNAPFYIYLKAKGVTGKSGDESGSFGIGKNAPYVVSNLRTVFASSVYQDEDGNCQQVTQGKSILSSFFDHDDNQRRGNGYWGVNEMCQPVITNDMGNLPEWIRRSSNNIPTHDELGTKITVLGFNEAEKDMWHERIASAISKNFFAAISDDRLEVHIGDKYVLNRNSLQTLMDSDIFLRKIEKAEDFSSVDEFKLRRDYLSIYEDEKIVIREKCLKYLGDCQVRIKIDENLPKKICFIRNGMFITDHVETRGIISFSGLKSFAAVFLCKNSKGNKLLRSMENPSHTSFDPKRLYEDYDQKRAELAIQEVGAWIREELNKYAKDKVSSVRDIEELLEFFSYEDQDQNQDQDSNKPEEVNPFSHTIEIKPIKKVAPSVVNVGPGGGGQGGGGQGGGGQGGGGDGTKRIVKNKNKSNLNNFRFIKKDKKIYKLFFTPTHTGNINLQIFASGEDLEKSLPVNKCNYEKIDNNCNLEVIDGERCEIEIELKNEFLGAIGVVAYEV